MLRELNLNFFVGLNYVGNLRISRKLNFRKITNENDNYVNGYFGNSIVFYYAKKISLNQSTTRNFLKTVIFSPEKRRKNQ
jgi:hypothetical protein